jgi:hypothetical protein
LLQKYADDKRRLSGLSMMHINVALNKINTSGHNCRYNRKLRHETFGGRWPVTFAPISGRSFGSLVSAAESSWTNNARREN